MKHGFRIATTEQVAVKGGFKEEPTLVALTPATLPFHKEGPLDSFTLAVPKSVLPVIKTGEVVKVLVLRWP